MFASQRSPRRAAVRQRLRWLLWRARFPIAAVCLASAAMIVVGQLRPVPPPTSAVVALRSPLAAGTTVTARDVHVVDVPEGLVPGAALQHPDAAVGRSAAVNLTDGTLLVPGLLAGSDITEAAPAGSVVVPVRLSDPAAVEFLAAGDRIDLVLVPDPGAAAPDDAGITETSAKGSRKNKDGTGAVVLAERALVLPTPPTESSGGGGLLGPVASDSGAQAVLLVAVDREEAHTLTAAARSGYIAAVLVE